MPNLVSCGKTVAALLVTLAPLPASAAVIYDGGAPDQGGSLYAQAPAAVAIKFTLQPGSAVVTDAHWWGRQQRVARRPHRRGEFRRREPDGDRQRDWGHRGI
jgi:hypothetical protein